MDDDEITRVAFAVAKGDAAAAKRFVAGTQRQPHRLLSYLSSPGVADDLAQEAYLRVFAALSGFEGRSPARMWLPAIAKRVAADHLRIAPRRPVSARTEDWVATAEQNGAYTPGPGRAVALRQLITELDAERRDAFVLTQVVGLSYAEAAEVCALGTIRSRVFRAREELTAADRASEWLVPGG